MWKRIMKSWRVLRGIPTYNDDDHFMETKLEVELVLKDLKNSMESVREFIPVMHTHQEFIRLNTQTKRLTLFVRENYGEEILDGSHSRLTTTVDVALYYMTRELESRGHKITPAPSVRDVLEMENAVGLGPIQGDPRG